jgi:hypothetical protein
MNSNKNNKKIKDNKGKIKDKIKLINVSIINKYKNNKNKCK